LPSSAFYEQPLNERIRLLMRLEFVFQHFDNGESTPVIIQQRLELNALLDLLDLISRGDTTSEVVKELERISNNLMLLQNIPGVDNARLINILNNVDSLTTRLNKQGSRHYQPTVEAGLLATLRRRHNVSCGNTEFDQPVLKHWFLKPEQTRRDQLSTWIEPFETLKLAVQLVLQLIRESAATVPSVAEAGFYQHTLDTEQPAQIIRVCPNDPNLYPVISAGRHRFTVRFMRQINLDPAVQEEEAVKFRLICCAI